MKQATQFYFWKMRVRLVLVGLKVLTLHRYPLRFSDVFREFYQWKEIS